MILLNWMLMERRLKRKRFKSLCFNNKNAPQKVGHFYLSFPGAILKLKTAPKNQGGFFIHQNQL